MVEAKNTPTPSPQSQAPGKGMAPPAYKDVEYKIGPSQEEIESPVQKNRDPRQDLNTSKVDSGGDKIWKRFGEPASVEEKKAAGDYIPPGSEPFKGGVQGVHPPGGSPPEKKEK